MRNRTYYSIENMKQGELDFFKATVLAKSMEPIFMCSDMPMADMSEDIEFGKKWMFAIAMSLKKGMHLNIIHNLDRPFNEMMMGLLSWVPLYMTGQISPYYLKGLQNTVYCHFNYVSGKVALTGECIKGSHNDGKYYLTTNTEEVEYYKKKCENLLNKAYPLMEIYRAENRNAYNSFIEADSKTTGSRRRIISSLPAHTISDGLLDRILQRNHVNDETSNRIRTAIQHQRNTVNTIMENNSFTDELTLFSEESFAESPVALFTADIFLEKRIEYTYQEYIQHLEQTKEYEKRNVNYHLKTTKNNAFKNIQIHMHEGEWAMISKNSQPAIHFVIHHSKLRDSIENFVSPL